MKVNDRQVESQLAAGKGQEEVRKGQPAASKSQAAEQGFSGGLGRVRGLRVGGISAGFRKNPQRKDLCLIVAAPGSKAAGVFTQNIFAAAPVLVCREHLALQQQGTQPGTGFRALIINSGNANAATGSQGLVSARATCQQVAEALDCLPQQVLVASTGVIGQQLPVALFAPALPHVLEVLGKGDGADTEEGLAAAEAIMTTDTVSKTAVRTCVLPTTDGGSCTCTLAGMCKGSGMIAPHMATMIAVIATDANLTNEALNQSLRVAVQVSFNRVTIDSDTSTNDSAYLIATGAAPAAELDSDSPALTVFEQALTELCQDLAYQIARDGEGATKVVLVDLRGAANEQEAELAARAIADSPLVKTAIAGHDANWGRIAMAAGKSGATFDPQNVSISIMDVPVLVRGTPQSFSEEEALRRFEQRDEILIVVDLGAGKAGTRMWTCDLTHGYIAINGDYRT